MQIRVPVLILAVFILEDTLCVWTNLGKHSSFVWLFVSSVKTGRRRIIRLDELSSVVRSSRTNGRFYTKGRIMRLCFWISFIQSITYVKPRIDTRLCPTTSLKVRPGNHKIFKCSAMELLESTKPGWAIPRNQGSKLYCMIFLQTTFTHLIFLKQLMQSLE